MSIKDIKISRSKILTEVVIFEPSVFIDERGDIYTSYIKEIYDQFLPEGTTFIHDKFAISKKNVLRGLHGDTKTWKLISCVKGEIFEVVVDYRRDSPNYLKWESWILNDKNKRTILVPPNFVNGYCVVGDEAVFHYKLSYKGEYIDAKDQFVVKWNDPRLNINWPCKNPILQERDK
ncbi:dTDP-4-dehydrorhamnose 3,5-epimerase family protein [Melioribacter sp. OK-6-Me]|uniref:dTDP-4-dehydrorhamnose 3,5-epimerase family protein n=1 Tax=Melioribacter sp. OK-6-Me TaxID=3423433 RepID=UPI003ED98215